MRLENEQLHYRTRFEVFPYDTTEAPLGRIQDVIWDWVVRKESRRGDSPLRDMLGNPKAHEAFLDGRLPRTPRSDGPATELANDALVLRHLDRRLWAMEYDEPDASVWFRRWHTQVGIVTSSDGPCVVNVRISYHFLPDYIGATGTVPFASVPNFVADVVSIPEFQACVGETVLASDVTWLDGGNFAEAFEENLLSPQRELPLVLMSTDREGVPPVEDPSDLARRLIGLANVYVADWSDAAVRGRMFGLFRKGTPASLYRCGPHILRVYRPGVDLGDPEGYRRHPYFNKRRMDGYGQGGAGAIVDILSRSLGRTIVREGGDVCELADVDWARRRVTAEAMRERLDYLRERMRQGELVPASAAQDVERLRQDLRETNELAEEYATENDRLREEVERLREEGGEASGDVTSLRYRAQSAEERAAALADRLREARHVSDVVEALDHVPTSLRELLSLVAELWPDRVVVLDEAYASAEGFRGDLDEEWRILRSVACVLWPLYFEDRDVGEMEEAYRSRAGYVLSLREVQQTNSDPKLVRMRRWTYRGEQVDVTPHIKGRSSNPKTAFRVHYHADHERRLIVIGHCGAHMTTSGTRRIRS